MTDPEDPETIRVLLDLQHCPHCNCSLVGDEIPETRRAFFGGVHTHGSRLLAIYDRERDRTSHFECPECRGRVDRGDPADTAGQVRTTNVEIRTKVAEQRAFEIEISFSVNFTAAEIWQDGGVMPADPTLADVVARIKEEIGSWGGFSRYLEHWGLEPTKDDMVIRDLDRGGLHRFGREKG